MNSPKILQQLAKPQGILGRLILNRLNAVNAGMNAVTHESLALDSSDRLLEIGFGGGALLHEIVQSGKCVNICATDLSNLAVSRAMRIFRREIEKGVLELQVCSDQSLPYKHRQFTKVCCVNVIYFWPDTRAALKEIYRILEKRGILVLTYCEQSPDGKVDFPITTVGRLLSDAGFSVSSSISGNDKENGTYHCTLAVKP